jgi:hypothetical protein
VKGRLEGQTKKQAALNAGYSQSMSEHVKEKIEKPEVEQLFKDVLEKAGISDEWLARIAKEGLDAVETRFFQKDGICTDERTMVAYSERREMLELICKLKGHLTEQHDVKVKLTLEDLLAESHGGE